MLNDPVPLPHLSARQSGGFEEVAIENAAITDDIVVFSRFETVRRPFPFGNEGPAMRLVVEKCRQAEMVELGHRAATQADAVMWTRKVIRFEDDNAAPCSRERHSGDGTGRTASYDRYVKQRRGLAGRVPRSKRPLPESAGHRPGDNSAANP